MNGGGRSRAAGDGLKGAGRRLGIAPAVLITLAALGATLAFGGADAFAVVVALSILEVSFSFDNAVLNAGVLNRMSQFWQRMFMSVGILVAVFGVRFVLPLALVAMTTASSPPEVFRLAVENPHLYQEKLESAHPIVAALGGTFLLLIFLDFLMSERETKWLRPLERFTARFASVPQLPAVVALMALVLVDLIANPPHGEAVLAAGMFGVVAFLLVRSCGDLLQERMPEEGEEGAERRPPVRGKAAFIMFCYLELLDASFSFDGVIGAFAITSDVVLITVGLGIGALYVRGLTVRLVRRRTLEEYIYLEHGAHYAIGALAVLMMTSIRVQVPDVFVGLIGIVFILAAVVCSRRAGSVREQHELGAEQAAPHLGPALGRLPAGALPVTAGYVVAGPVRDPGGTALRPRTSASGGGVPQERPDRQVNGQGKAQVNGKGRGDGAVPVWGGVNGRAVSAAPENAHGEADERAISSGEGDAQRSAAAPVPGAEGWSARAAMAEAAQGLRRRAPRLSGRRLVIRLYVEDRSSRDGVTYARRAAPPESTELTELPSVVYPDDDEDIVLGPFPEPVAVRGGRGGHAESD